MQIYQVPRFKVGYTLIELLVVILITGLFFYLVVPSVKNILPEQENENILNLIDVIEKASRDAIEQKQKVIFILNIDSNAYAIITEQEINNQADEEGGEETISFIESPLTFVRAQNSSKELSAGLITFVFFPDGSKEFGRIWVATPDEGTVYTIYLNPYTVSPEIIRGDVRFEEDYIL